MQGETPVQWRSLGASTIGNSLSENVVVEVGAGAAGRTWVGVKSISSFSWIIVIPSHSHSFLPTPLTCLSPEKFSVKELSWLTGERKAI
jgi:hypothetical protein